MSGVSLHQALSFLGQGLERFEPGAIGYTVLGIIGALTVFVLVMAAVKGWRDNFSRKPPIDEDLRVYSATVTKLQSDLEKLPDDKKFDELVKRLDTFATVPQVTALQEALHREIKNVDAYAHKNVHDARGELGARITQLEEAAIHRGERLARSEAHIETCMRSIDTIFTRVENQADRIADKVEGLLKERGVRR